jgi:ketosteroid isomerase-like protein
MTSNAERATILERALRAGIDGDRDAIDELYTEDVTAWSPVFGITSRTELVGELERRDEAFSDVELEVTALDVGGDYACAEWRVTMTHTGDLRLGDVDPIPATGVTVTLNGVTIAEFRGGKICSFRQYWNEVSILDQLGFLQDGD